MCKREVKIVVGLLLLVTGVWYMVGHVGVGGRTKAEAPAVVASVKTATAAVAGTNGSGGVSLTNYYGYRVTNSKKGLAEMMADKRAVLLGNALIDTSAGLNLGLPAKLKAADDPGAYIVQARAAINLPFEQELTLAGATVVSYIPNNALLVRATAAVASQLRNEPAVMAVIPYEPFYKLSPELARVAVGADELPTAPVYKLAFFPGEEQAGLDQLKLGGWTVLTSGVYPTVRGGGDWTELAANPHIKFMELGHLRKAANDLARVTMGISTDTITTTNYLNLSGSNVLVELNDSGVDTNHPDLAGRVTFDAISTDGTDPDGHGTHVAGIIMGSGLESPSINRPPNLPSGSVSNANFRGKAPLAHLFVEGGTFNGGSGLGDEYLQAAAALTNALISNNSWDYDGDFQYDLAAASYDAAVRDALPLVPGSQPVLFVFAAGNSGGGTDNGNGGNADTINSPATAKNVITVGAMEQLRNITNLVTDGQGKSNAVWQGMTDTSFEVASFSARGNVGIGVEGTGGRFKPDVVAPGTFVVSTRSSTWDQFKYFDPTNYFFSSYTDQTAVTNALQYYPLTVPNNAVSLALAIVPNANSAFPFPTNLPVYLSLNNPNIDPANPATYDFATRADGVSIPPSSGGLIAGIQSLQNGGCFVGVGDSVATPVNYDLNITIATTNDQGNYLEVLSNLDSTLSPFYRYETGTSMSAPAVSGLLALLQDYFTNTLQQTPSPALLKAMVINGARPLSSYRYAVGSDLNYQGWGLAELPTALQPGTTNVLGTLCSEFFTDQSPTNALATSERHNYRMTVTNVVAQAQALRVTLVWTDPPGDPAAAIKLVNNLDLVVTNLDNGAVYYGNNFSSSGTPPYSTPWNTNNPAPADTVNNVENVFLPPFTGTNFTVAVVAEAVNVNAVTAHTNDIVQDYALVISSGDGSVSNALVVTDVGTTQVPVSGQQITFVTTTNQPYLNQFAGASSPLLGTNTLGLGSGVAGGTVYATNAVLTLGETNQWQFFVVTNNTPYTNAAFVTFQPSTLSIPRMGVFANDITNATRPEADIDLYVSTDPSITNLNPVAISNCVYGVGLNRASLSRGGTEYVAYETPAVLGQVFYVGIKAEDQMAAEYDFIPIFSQSPFAALNRDGSQTVYGVPVPAVVPDGTPYLPGKVYLFGLAIYPMEVAQVIVTNAIFSENFGDLYGLLTHGATAMVLNNHAGYSNPLMYYTNVYDDVASGNYPGSQPSDGPGSLRNYFGNQASGVWVLTESDNASQQGSIVENFSMRIVPHQEFRNHGITLTIQPGAWFYDFIDVPAGYTNLTVFATNEPPAASPPLQLYVQPGSLPTLTNVSSMVLLNQGNPPGNDISIGPPLVPQRYFVGIFNPTAQAQTVFLVATLGFDAAAVVTADYASDGAAEILDDAVSYSQIAVPATNIIQSFNVGLRVSHPRISDLTFHLIAPDGTRYLLMENRGGTTTNGAGSTIFITNTIPVAYNGTAQPNTNTFDTGTNAGTITINYNFYTLPDQIVVYAGSTVIWNPGLINGSGTMVLPYSGSSIITILLNPNGNPNPTTAWQYSVTSTRAQYNYLSFTEDTNLTTTPIKFAPTPFVPSTTTNVVTQFITNVTSVFTTNNVTNAALFYTNDFSGPVGPEWNNTSTDHTPTGNKPFLGQFGNNYITLSLSGLPPHDTVTLNFELYIINSMDGSCPIDGPDVWDLSLVEATNHLLHATFSNFPEYACNSQSYPEDFPGPDNPAYTGSIANSSLGFLRDATYLMHYPLSLTNSSIAWAFSATNLQALTDESWGLAHVSVTTSLSSTNVVANSTTNVTSVVVTNIAVNNEYYLPEQPMSGLIGESAEGLWQLEIQDSRAGAGLTNSVDSWRLEFTYANLNYGVTLTGGEPQTNVVPANSLTWYNIAVPADASYATNMLLYASAPVNFLYSPNNPPTLGGTGDLTLAANVTSYSRVFSTNTVPLLVPGQTYYLGVQNTGAVAVTNVVRVDFDSTFFAALPPVFLATPANTNIPALATLVVTNAATDADPRATLKYSLINPPAGMTIGTNGVITWTPGLNQTNTYTIITAVTNSEDPPLGVTNVFTVTVTAVAPLPAGFAISSIYATNQSGANGYLLSWYAATNYQFQVKWATSLVPANWQPFTNIISYKTYVSPTNSLFQFFDDGTQDGGFGTLRYYRVYLY